MNDVNFRYKNLCTSYQYVLGKGSTDCWVDMKKSIPDEHSYCFQRLFATLDNAYRYNQECEISICIQINKSKTSIISTYNNLVLLKKDAIIRHIEYLKRLFDFKYNLVSERTFYKLQAKLVAKPIQIKFFCAWIRYLYEFPANVMMLDIYRLIDAGQFRGESLFNLIMLINCCLRECRHVSIRGDQCIKINGIFLDEKSLKTKLNRGRIKLNKLYKDLDTPKIQRIVQEIKFPLTTEDAFKLSSWLDEDSLADRYIAYEKALEIYNS